MVSLTKTNWIDRHEVLFTVFSVILVLVGIIGLPIIISDFFIEHFGKTTTTPIAGYAISQRFEQSYFYNRRIVDIVDLNTNRVISGCFDKSTPIMDIKEVNNGYHYIEKRTGIFSNKCEDSLILLK